MTASTEGKPVGEEAGLDGPGGPVGPVESLHSGHVAEALALSSAAHWNQTADDWAAMLDLGQGFGLRARAGDASRRLVASTVVLPFDAGFAWISMVLVLPAWRGKGLASRLLRHALAQLDARGLLPVLDATPAGRAVYARLGFADTLGFTRLRVDADRAGEPHAAPPAGVRLCALSDRHLDAVSAFDRTAFGAGRSALLRTLARRQPQAAWVAESADGGVRGFVLARDGREAFQVGPLLAEDPLVAVALLDAALAALPGPVFADLLDDKADLRPQLAARGFEPQRPFTRMVREARPGRVAAAPGRTAALVLVAGPELG